MARADKQAAVAEIVDSFNDAAGAVLTEYRGLTVKELQDLRRSLGENADYAVVKNTLAKLAATEVGISGFDELLTGPTAIAFIKGDVVEAAKGLRDFAKTNPALVIKGGILDGNLLDAEGDRQARRPRVARGAPGQAGRRDARLAQPGRLPAQRAARPGRPSRGCAPGEGRGRAARGGRGSPRPPRSRKRLPRRPRPPRPPTSRPRRPRRLPRRPPRRPRRPPRRPTEAEPPRPTKPATEA